MESIKVVSACDSCYARPLGVMIISLLENTSSKDNIEFFIIDGGIHEQDKEKLQICVEKYGSKINFLTLNPERYENLKIHTYITIATYFRIFLPELLENTINKIIYLDCDLIIKGDIVKFWDYDVSQHYIAAVEDGGMENCGDYGVKIKRKIGVPRKIKYFNAGVLIINLEKWRINNISEKIRDYLINNKEKITFADQDGLNAIFVGQWLPLPMAWNVQTAFFDLLYKNRITRKEMMDAVQNPMIIHYTDRSKPWYSTDIHPLRSEFIKYALLTPWSDIMPHYNRKDKLIKAFKESLVGKALNYYRGIIHDYYLIDQTYFSNKLRGSKAFIFMYSLFFPFVYIYLRFFSKITLLSYSLENKKPVGDTRYILNKMLLFCLFPIRYLIPKLLRSACKEDSLKIKYTCPCCGYKTFTKEAIDEHETCRNCYWEYDTSQHNNPEYDGGANDVSLVQAQQNYILFGVSDVKYRYRYNYNEKPFYICRKDKNWKMFTEKDKTYKESLVKRPIL